MSTRRHGAAERDVDEDLDAIECRIQPILGGSWAEVYAQAGPNFPSYADEEYIGEAPMVFLKKRVDIERSFASIPYTLFKQIRRLSRMGWPGKHK